MKKFFSLVLALALLTSCLSFAAAEDKVTLTVWSFTDELGGMIDNYFKPAHPEIEIVYQMYPPLISPANWIQFLQPKAQTLLTFSHWKLLSLKSTLTATTPLTSKTLASPTKNSAN